MSLIVTPSERSRPTATAIVKRQIKRMSDPELSRLFQDTIFEEIRRDRVNKKRSRIEALEFSEHERVDFGQDFVVVVGGEVLVADDDADEAAAILENRGFRREPSLSGRSWDATPPCVQELRRRVVRFANPGASLQQATAAVRRLRQRNIQASVNYVLPLGYVAKGEGGFEPTEVNTLEGPGDEPGTGARVAVIDTGIAPQGPGDGWLDNIPRPDGSVDPLYRVLPDQLDFAAGHGTFVAGIIQQVAPTAQITVYNAIGSDGIGSDVHVAEAILAAAHDGAQVINLSLGTPTRGGERPVATQVALQILEQEHPDVVVVASAGNSPTSKPFYPASFPGVQAVASLKADLTPSEWSSHGPNVAFSAIGEGICSTFVAGRESEIVDPQPGTDVFTQPSWAIGTGTSFAAPQITGEIVNRMGGPPPRTAWQACQDLKTAGQPHADYGVRLQILPGTPR